MSRSRGLVALIMVLAGMLFVCVDVASAEETNGGTRFVDDKGAKAIGGGIGAGLVLMGGGAAIGRIGSSSVESMARQPEVAGQINTAMLITAAMVEGATLFAVLGCFLATIA